MRASKLLILLASIYCHFAVASDSILRVAIPNSLPNIHPFEATTAQQNFILPLIYESLLVTEITGDTRPNLIKEWKINEQERSLTFKIRDDVFFSDGSRLTLEDVVASFRVICEHPGRSKDLSIVKGCSPYKASGLGVKVSGDTVKINIHTHPSYLLSKLAGENILILKRHKGGFIGTGPLKIKALTEKELVLERNALHRIWSKGSRFSEVHFVFTDERYIKETVEKNKMHVASMYMTSTAMMIKNPDYVTINHAPNVVQTIVLNSKVFPFTQLKLRNAIHARLKELPFESCAPGSRKTNGFIPKGIGGSFDAHEGKSPAVSLVEAKLKKAISLKFHRHIGRKNECEESKIRGVFKEFGIELQYVYHDDYETLDRAVLDPKVAGFIELYVFKSRDASAHLKNMVPGNHPNFYLFESQEIKKILESAWNAKDLRSRFNYYKQINKIIFDSSTLIDLYAVGHTNMIHRCLVAQKEDVSYYNPNSFLFLLRLDFNSKCNLGDGT